MADIIDLMSTSSDDDEARERNTKMHKKDLPPLCLDSALKPLPSRQGLPKKPPYSQNDTSDQASNQRLAASTVTRNSTAKEAIIVEGKKVNLEARRVDKQSIVDIVMQDEQMARQLQEKFDKEDTDATKRARNECTKDERVARKLQMQLAEEEAKAQREANEKAVMAMSKSTTGMAVLFVQEILDTVDEWKKSSQMMNVDAVAKDDMVFLAESTLTIQEEFRKAGKPTTVDLGFHYTSKTSLESIRTGGLLTLNERQTRGIQSKCNGRSYGDGIYTADDAVASVRYGDIGLLVVRLLGVESSDRSSTANHEHNHDTFVPIGTKWKVLRNSSQCLALIHYPAAMASGDNAGLQEIASFESAIQRVVDKHFNNNKSASATKT